MKNKVLVIVYPKIGGCQFFRQTHAHELLSEYSEFEITYVDNFTLFPDNYFKQFHLVQFHKNYVTPEILIKLKVLGIITIVDFDDYWHLPYNHLSFLDYKKNNTPYRFIEIIKQASCISTTTELLANEIKKYNLNAFVFPNSLDLKLAEIIKVKSYCIRFGYIGGACHLPDVELLRGINNKLNSSNLEYTLNLFGYKNEGVYFDYANVLTDNGRFTDNLNLYPSLPVPDYLQYYNMIDTSLIPLVANKFNGLKSELKLVEAGLFKKAVIVSDASPYNLCISHKKNGLVSEFKSDWYKNISYLIKNPNAVIDFGNQLYHGIKMNFNYLNITNYRKEIYQHIIQKGL